MAAAAGLIFAAPVLLTIVFAFADPPFSALMVWRGLEGNGADYRWTRLDDMGQALPATVIMSEDGRFC
ncbi:MAG TPA: monofunctional biosynthetic peptidoglycan transglycosylase, partial [Hyphomicrobiales bacterium]|nr:monofunctional biosynthetic peptidoglycan transglycosylase [Hyphomicrobiales bacterium]